ncbi:hypothetical protein DVQ84_07430 [Yersinia enterocolitica]|nr:hypothetical protein [Yersinia enterocolitica]EKN6031070.1 hypothetical protein [Yersinia enterocolitica]EKN6069505.1 hypothetical protein [Yersinia enterocolitica]EKN6185458.1 hypothetical protein [Yersinia enterocolitica]EKN6188651.1 hypothetical protein [Yersinia enterocolitica]
MTGIYLWVSPAGYLLGVLKPGTLFGMSPFPTKVWGDIPSFLSVIFQVAAVLAALTYPNHLLM